MGSAKGDHKLKWIDLRERVQGVQGLVKGDYQLKGIVQRESAGGHELRFNQLNITSLKGIKETQPSPLSNGT